MADLVMLKTGPKAPEDLAKRLREEADAVDRGEITAYVSAFVRDGQYEVAFGASWVDSLVLSTLLQTTAVEKFKE